MTKYVLLSVRRPRGWPWPDDESGGLGPLYGESGWCRRCGMPQGPQVGALRLQKRGLTVAGGWVPNWLYDFHCVENSAVEAGRALGLEFRPVLTPKGESLGASQIVIESTAHEWFDVGDLARILVPP